MGRALAVVYGVLGYLIFLISFLYAIGFVTNIGVPKGIDSGAPGPVLGALIVNMLLMGLFAAQHSVMARPEFKRWWTTIIPEPIERSTYVLLSSLALILLYWLWQPIPGLVWSVEGAGAAILWTICALGWGIVLLSTLMIGHFELFGLQQVYQHLQNLRPAEPTLITPGFYALVRHPIMTGFIIAFWATPQMSWGHLLFAAVTTIYIVLALQFEERDLIGIFGERYREYSAKVPM
ncbi:MAG TPA: isoprenylcysteine carboxylmethyltransferase family protein, partial [Alphaproteobacteria bacterium]|nr:isoprenylcysteine carboxylmethyltransferase family protein [Alphaproteobacteria bacterium]